MNRNIETDRLFLRPLVISDAKDVFEWVGDPVVNTYMPYSLYQNVQQVEEWLTSIEDEDYEFAFCLKDTGKCIWNNEMGKILLWKLIKKRLVLVQFRL